MHKYSQRLLASLFLVTGAFAAPALAKESPELTDRTFRTVNKVQELIATEKYTDAIEKLTSALERTKSKKYDRAVLLQQMGFLYSLKDDYANAAKFFALALQNNSLPVPIAQQVRYSLAQLYLAEEQYKKSVSTMKQWFEIAKTTEEKPEPHAYITLASAYVQMGDYKNAIPPTKTAISLSSNPSESWYLLLMSSHYELKQLKSVAGVLKTLTNKHPQKKRYWMQLSGIYMELQQEKNSLAALDMAYKLGLFEKEKEYLRLVNFQAYQGIPYRAAKILKQAIDQGSVEKNVKNIEKLAGFWHQAKELDQAILAYQSAFELEPSAKRQIKIVRLMLQDKQYKNATDFTKAKSSDSTKDNLAELAYLRGMAYFEMNKPENALKAMQIAADSKEFKSAVAPWINFLKDQS